MSQLKRIFRSKYRNRIDDKLSDLYAELAVLTHNLNNHTYDVNEYEAALEKRNYLHIQINLLNTLLK